jgi:two-component system, chemotaxis family, protein-glutamate methylesterase/glutaminase
MASNNIRVLVVDDSAVIRAMICDHIAASPGLEVAGTASDGHRALEIFRSVQPDVVTLDVQMPGLDGLETLDAILAERPVPVVMVSSLTQRGGEVTFEALDRGAIEYVAKPERGEDAADVLGTELVRKIRMVAGTDVRRILEIRRERKHRRSHRARRSETPEPPADACPTQWVDKCIAIGISTGGPPALSLLFQMLRPPMPPIVVVQHMPPHFTGPLALRLNSISALSIAEAASGDVLRPNCVLIAQGGIHLSLRRHDREMKVVLRDGPPVSGHKPSIDVMMQSVAELFPGGCLGIIMTGMGRDGADGCRAIRAAGGYVLGQDEASSDVYGMNKVAHVENNVDRQFALSDAAGIIARQVRRLWPPAGGAAP